MKQAKKKQKNIMRIKNKKVDEAYKVVTTKYMKRRDYKSSDQTKQRKENKEKEKEKAKSIK